MAVAFPARQEARTSYSGRLRADGLAKTPHSELRL